MRVIKSIVVLLLAVIPALSQQKATPEDSVTTPEIRPSNSAKGKSEDTPASCRFEGTVVGTDGNPLRRAALTLVSPGSDGSPRFANVESGTDGSFRFENLQPDVYTLAAQKAGFIFGDLTVAGKRSKRSKVVLGDPCAIKDAVIRLHVTPVISGRVLDEDGEPLAGVVVQSIRKSSSGQVMRVSTTPQFTNDLGEFRISGLQPGSYYLLCFRMKQVMADGRLMMLNSGQGNAMNPYYYPGTYDPTQAQVLTVAAGEEARIDLPLLPTELYSIRGRVVADLGNGKTLTTPTMVALRRKGGSLPGGGAMATSDATGAFEIKGLVPGEYVVLAQTFPSDEEDRPFVNRTSVQIFGDVTDVALTLEPPRRLQGQIVLAERKNNKQDFSSFYVSLVPDAGKPIDFFQREWMNSGSSNASVEEDGSFSIELISEENVYPYLSGDGDEFASYYLKSATLNGRDVLESGIPAQSTGKLEITIAAEGTNVEGTVIDDAGSPVGGAIVVGVPEAKFLHRPDMWQRTGRTDSRGRFRFVGIPPGSYDFVAMEPEDGVLGGEELDLDFLIENAEKGEPLTAMPNSKHSIKLKVLSREQGAP